MRIKRFIGRTALCGILLAGILACVLAREKKHPVYVGARVCGRCHQGEGMGRQFSTWLASKHARAYLMLSKPESAGITELSGVPLKPRESTLCLACHATASYAEDWEKDPTFHVEDGVQCEACHGPGSEYAVESIMRDRAAAMEQGLKMPTMRDCAICHYVKGSHTQVHGKEPLDLAEGMKWIAHPTPEPSRLEDLPPPPPFDPASIPPEAAPAQDAAARKETVQYKTPLNIAFRPNSRELWAACEASHSVIIVDAARLEKIDEVAVGQYPNDVAFSPDGREAYVSNRLDDTVSVLDAVKREVAATIPVGDEPHGLLTDGEGVLLYVLNTSSDSISVVDTRSRKEIKRLAASRSPWSLSLSPDKQRMFVSNYISRFVPFRQPPMSEITAIDTSRGVVEDRFVAPAANLIQGIDWHPDGGYALFTLNRTKNLVPMTRLLQGWTITNGLGIVWADGRVDQVLLDNPGRCFPDAADVAFSPDGSLAAVTSSGSNAVALVDCETLISIVTSATDYEREHVLPNHLGKSTEFVIARLDVEHSPRGVVFSSDGSLVFAANALDDSISVIDVRRPKTVKRIDLGGPKEITRVRFGERVFHSADITFQRQFSCHSCHPDGHIDGLTYDIEPDGIGISPVDNRTLRGILDTAPFKWSGLNPSLQRQCGPRLAVFFTRISPFTPEELSALDNYICTIPRPPNRYRPLGAPLTAAQRRGKAMFERMYTNDGRIIPEEDRCNFCHPPPYYTDRQTHDVGTQFPSDKDHEFDTPHLNNIYDSAPYLHNGIAPTLEEIWTLYNPEDKHGVTNDMTKDQLNDLIEYLKTL